MKKEIFSMNLRTLMGDSTREDTAEALDVSKSIIDKWLNESDTTLPSWKYIDRICKCYHCDPAYLFTEHGKDFNIEYKAITEITGLSSKSIEVLNRIKKASGKTKYGMAFGVGKDTHSWKHIAMINYILEDMYDHNYMSDDYNGEEPILSVMYDYLHTENIQHIHSMKDVNAFGIVRAGDDLDQVLFYDQETHVKYTLPNPVKLFRRTMMDSIQQWLEDQTRKQEKTATDRNQ